MKKLFILLLLFTSALLSHDVQKKILLLHSYHPDMTWVENIDKAVSDTLKPDQNNLLLYRDYMDSKRHNSKEYYQSLKELYKKKYKDIDFDLILVTDNNAFDFMLENRDELFGNTPVSFSGVNDFDIKTLDGKSGFTGAAERFSAKETVDEIFKLQPDVEEIYIINDYLPTGRAWERDIKKALKGYEERVKLTYNENLTLEELKEKISTLGEKSAVLLGVFFADKDNNYISYEKVGSHILEESKAPTYVLLNFNITDNVVGGKVIGGYSQGKAMSLVGEKILKGVNPDTIAVQDSEANEFIFNYKGLEKYGLDMTRLPSESTILNKPSTLYQNYKTVLLILLMFFLVVAFVMIAFFIYIKVKEKSKEEYKEKFIITILRFAPLVILPITTIFIMLVFIYFSNKNYEVVKQNEKQLYIQSMKDISQREVERYAQIAQKCFSKKDDNTSLENVETRLLGIASSIKYGKSGYLFIGSMKGYALSHPDKNLEGASFFDGKHERARKVFLKFKEIIEKDGGGFVTYEWENPMTHSIEKKTSYVKYIPELDWYVASGVHLANVEEYVQNKLKTSEELEEKKINFLLIISLSLVILVVGISFMISKILKTVFDNYKRNITMQEEENKRRDAILFQQSKMAEMGMMMGAILHQWKQPISVLSILSDALADIDEDLGGNADLNMVKCSLEKQVGFMNETVENFRKFSNPNIQQDYFSLYEVVVKIKTMFKSQFEKKNINIVINKCDNLEIFGVEGEMMHVVLNILTNARDAFQESGADKKTITVDIQKYENRAMMIFIDNAGGIPEDLLPDKLFEAHLTTKGELGSGVGLYICKQIVEQKYKGKISAMNMGEGAKFSIDLPLN